MGIYKICHHTGRERDRCEHAWWGTFRGIRVSLERWGNVDIRSKAQAHEVYEDLRRAIRHGTFQRQKPEPVPKAAPMTFRAFADIYVQRHVVAKKLARAKGMSWRLRPLLDRFGDRTLTDIKTADVEDWIADLRKPRLLYGREHTLSNASVNRQIETARHMFNWAIGREYLERTPFRRGTETLIKKLREDNRRRRRLSEEEEAKILSFAPPHLRSLMIVALDTGMRRGEMLALRLPGHRLRPRTDHAARRNH
jgi:hypothetical protein